MLASFQSFVVDLPRVVRRFHGAFHPRLWVHVVEQSGCTDEALLPNLALGRPDAGRRLTGVVLGGTSKVRFVDGVVHTLSSGEGTSCNGRGTFRSRAESSPNEPSLSITLDWDAGWFASRAISSAPSFRVASLTALRESVDRLRNAIERAWQQPGDGSGGALLAVHVADVLSLLAAEGLDVPSCTAQDLATDVSSDVGAMSRALDRALSRTAEVPMLVDVEAASGVSARTVQRVLPRVLEAWGQNGSPESFRSMRTRVQLVRACLVMSHPEATTERAAQIVGFSSPNALCRAFAQQDLPSPGRIRERLRSLEAT
jgi:AraC-like DNA-binding protein